MRPEELRVEDMPFSSTEVAPVPSKKKTVTAVQPSAAVVSNNFSQLGVPGDYKIKSKTIAAQKRHSHAPSLSNRSPTMASASAKLKRTSTHDTQKAPTLGSDRFKFAQSMAKAKDLKQSVQKSGAYFRTSGKVFVYDPRSLFIFSGTQKFRYFTVQIMLNAGVSYAIQVLLILNGLCMAAFNMEDREGLTQRNQVLNFIFTVTNMMFVAEVLLKVIAMGCFMHKNAYLREVANQLECLLALIGLLEYFVRNSPADIYLKTALALRPFRIVYQVPSMKRLAKSIAGAMPDYINVSIFLLFMYTLFGIIGLHMFVGLFYYRCRLTPEPVDFTQAWKFDEDINRLCGAGFSCPESMVCGALEEYYMPIELDKIRNQKLINYGITTFDNMPRALLTVFQVVTMDGWTSILYNLMDSHDQIFPALLFCFIILLGSFFMLNLILAVVLDSFTKIQKFEIKHEKEEQKNVLEELLADLEEEEPDATPQDGEPDDDLESIEEESEDSRSVKSSVNASQRSHREQTSHNKTFIDHVDHGGQSVDLGISVDQMIGFDGPSSDRKQLSQQKTQPSTLKQVDDLQRNNSSNIMQKLTFLKGRKKDKNNILKVTQIAEKKASVQLQGKGKRKSSKKRASLADALIQKMQNGVLAQIKSNMNSPKADIKQDLNLKLQKMIGFRMKQKSRDETDFAAPTLMRRATTVRTKSFEQAEVMADIELRNDKNRLLKLCYDLQESRFVIAFINLATIANIVVLSEDEYPISTSKKNTLELLNQIFALVFLLEMLVRLLGLGLKAYFRDPFNTFDCVVVSASIVDFALAVSPQDDAIVAFLHTLRVFRLLRMFKLAKSWKRFRELLKTIGKTLKDIATFSILLFLFLIIYTLIGMQVYAHRVKFNKDNEIDLNGKSPQSNFDYFLEGFATTFIVIVNDGWSQIFYDHYRSQNGALAIVFFLSLIMIGQYLLLNLFLAILLQNFEADSKEHEKDKQRQLQKRMLEKLQDPYYIKWFKQFKQCLKKKLIRKSIMPIDSKEATKRLRIFQMAEKKNSGSASGVQDSYTFLAPIGNSLNCLKSTNKYRMLSMKIVRSRVYNYTMIIVVLIALITVAIDSPLNEPESSLWIDIWFIDVICALIFLAELVLKVVAYGLVFNGKFSYLRNWWNVLDSALIFIQIFSIVLYGSENSFVVFFRVLRCLRPLRFIGKVEGLRIAVHSLVLATPQIFAVLVISFLVFVIFSILSIAQFKGKFASCSSNVLAGFDSTAWECFNAGGNWKRFSFNFDNIGNAMLTLTSMSTTVGWAEVMYNGMGATEPGYALQEKHSPAMALYFIFFMILSDFFILNLFVGIVISTFNREKDKLGKNFMLSDQQKEWLNVKLLMFRSKPKICAQEQKNNFRNIFFKLQNSPYFERTIMVCILLNTIVLMVKWYDEPVAVTYITEILNYIFAAVFLGEALIKLIALGRLYFKDKWNVFDFVVVIGTLFATVMGNLTSVAQNLGAQTTIIRSFRIIRVIKLIKRAKALRLIFTTFMVTLPALANTGGLLIIFLYIYSIIGIQLFAKVKLGGALTPNANFQTFGYAFLTLFRSSTGEAWHQLMYDVSKKYSLEFQCIDDPSYVDFENNDYETVGCGRTYGYAYFLSYLIFVKLIFLNLFIAIILQGFDDTNQRDNRLFNNETAEVFRDKWSKYDPTGSSFIQIHKLADLLVDLGPPLGLKSDSSQQDHDAFIAELDLPIYNDFQDYQFMDVLEALSLHLLIQEAIQDHKKKLSKKDSYEQELDKDEEVDSEEAEKKIEEEVRSQFKADLQALKEIGTKGVHAIKEVAKKEMTQAETTKNYNKDQEITSSHYKAAKIILNQMKRFVRKRHEARAAEQEELRREIESMSPTKDRNEKDFKTDLAWSTEVPNFQGLQGQQNMFTERKQSNNDRRASQNFKSPPLGTSRAMLE